ncbi:MAG: hypothetical protein ACREEZ_11300, partial [Stellaceae bacterium]
MIWRRALRLCRIPALALPVSAPGFVGLATLARWGAIAPRLALVCGAVILLLTTLVIGRFVVAAAAVRDTVEEIAAVEGAQRAPWRRLALGPSRAADEIRLAILRLARAWRERLESAQARLQAAETILAAVPDPLILIDQRRRIVGANAAAADFVGALFPPPDLAAALRNP